MINRLISSQPGMGFRYAILGLLVISLLAGGYIIGNMLYALFQTSATSATTDAVEPAGGAIVSPPRQLQDFTLTSHTGEPLNLSDLRGQAVLMFFGYTHCPDVCPTTLADYTRVKQALGSDAGEVAFVFISVDWERDTPDVLAQYLSQFDSGFIGMTGDEATLRQIGGEYGLVFQQETISGGNEPEAGTASLHGDNLDVENYFVQHTSPSFLIDRDGYMRLVYFYGTEPEVIADGIRQMLQERE